MQLLKITSNPIEYELKIERPRLEIKQPQPSVVRETQNADLQMQSKNIAVRMDTVDMRRSIGIKSNTDFAADAAQLGKEAVQNKTAQYTEIGYQMSQANTSISDIAAQTFYPPTPMIETRFLPSVGPNISWDLNQLNVEYTAPKLTNDWRVMKNTMEYIPGKISMNITQFPSITIEYLGEPIYAPPSANPNYSEE